jgi:hypothetical protein
MAGIVPFTDNFSDLSNGQGFQFEFQCERCGNGYRSPFVKDKKEMGRGLLRGAGSLLGGKVAALSNAAETLDWNRGTNSAAKDKALEEAIEAVRDEFKQCRGCGNWACVTVCWNHDVGQCLTCSPSVAEEVSRAQAEAQREQIWEKAKEKDWTADLDLQTRAKVTCGACGAKIDGGKFCSECGQATAKSVFCTNCGTEEKGGAKFCSECGGKMGG